MNPAHVEAEKNINTVMENNPPIDLEMKLSQLSVV